MVEEVVLTVVQEVQGAALSVVPMAAQVEIQEEVSVDCESTREVLRRLHQPSILLQVSDSWSRREAASHETYPVGTFVWSVWTRRAVDSPRGFCLVSNS